MAEHKTSHERARQAGAKIIAVYVNAIEHEHFKARAASLGLSLSKYFALLARNDLEKKEELPPLKPQITETPPTVDETALKLAKLASEQITAKRKKKK